MSSAPRVGVLALQGGVAEHAALVVEAVEVVGDADRVIRERVRAAPLRRLGDGPLEPTA